MRILTILLLPLLFVATSCDSGGEGSACAVDPTGTWEFTQFDLIFSEECDCGEGTTCEDALGASTILEDLECVDVLINAGYVLTNRCECDNEGRTAECEDVASYTCSDNVISSDGDVWLITGNTASTGDIQTIDEFLSEWDIESDWDFGIGCSVTTVVSLAKQ